MDHPDQLDEWTRFEWRPPPPDTEVQFWRRGVITNGPPHHWTGKAKDLHPAFNVSGLYWCPLPAPPQDEAQPRTHGKEHSK